MNGRRFALSFRSAVSALRLSIAVRLVYDLALDCENAGNGAWLSALLGGLLALPALVMYRDILASSLRDRRAALAPILLLLCALIDGAGVLSGIARSAAYLSPRPVSEALMLLPVALAVIWCVSRRGDAPGDSAALWTRAIPLLLIVIVSLQLRCLNPRWLNPAFSEGFAAIQECALRAAGDIAALSGLWLLTDPQQDGPQSRRDILVAPMAGVAAALPLLILHCMMTPPVVNGGASWLNRLDALLTNGRAPLYLQLPMIAVWLMSLAHLAACEGLLATGVLRRLMPHWSHALCAALAVLMQLALAVNRQNTAFMLEAYYRWRFPALLFGLAADALYCRRRRRQRPCENAGLR